MLRYAVTRKSQDEDALQSDLPTALYDQGCSDRQRGRKLFLLGKCHLYNSLTQSNALGRVSRGLALRRAEAGYGPVESFGLGKLGKIVSLNRIFRLKDLGDPTENGLAAFSNLGMRGQIRDKYSQVIVM